MKKYHIIALLTIAVWGITFISTKVLINNGMSPSMIFFARFLISYLGIWFLFIGKKGFKLFADSFRDEMLMLFIGLTGGTIYFLAENNALVHTQACNVSFITCSAPLFTIILTLLLKRYFKGEMIDKLEDVRVGVPLITGTVLAICGMIAVIFNGGQISFSSVGDLYAIGAALCWALYSVVAGQMTERYGSLLVTRKLFFYGVLTILPFVRFDKAMFDILLTPVVIWNILFLSILASIICYAAWNRAMAVLGNVTSTNYVYLNPVFTLIGSIIILKESLSVQEVLGCAAILGGVILSSVRKRTGAALLVALVMLCSVSCKQESAEARHARQVDELMEKMTLQQKVAQIFAISVVKDSSPERTALHDSLVRRGVGSLILMRGPLEPFIDRANELQGYAELPLLVTLDAEWGASMRFDEYPLFPRQWELGHIENAEDLLYEMGRNVGKELKDLNIYVNFAPVVDLASGKDGLSRIESRQFSSDHRKVAKYGLAYMKGMQDEGICACGKHFPGFSGTRPDSHYSLPVSFNSRERIDTVELYPYKQMIEAGLKMVMMGHLSLPSVDSTGIPMSISRKGVTGLLKEELGFKGLVITDALQMGAISNQYSPLESNLMAYRAGVDILLWPGEILETMDAIEDSIRCGVYPMEELDAKVRKILELKAEFGFFDKGYNPIVNDVQKKVSEARERDEDLIRRMTRRLNDCGYGDPIPDWSDPTVVMEKMAK